jgi:cytochrome c-type biogenesis protein CcsB
MMNDALLFGISSVFYLFAMVYYLFFLIFKKNFAGKIASYVVYTGFIVHTAGFIYRWYIFSRSFSLPFFQSIPVTNLYESLLFFAWCLILGNIMIELKIKTHIFGFFITAIAGMSIAFVDAIGANKIVQPILPALRSNWLLAHATLSFVAYAAFGLSFTAAMLNLIYSVTDRKSKAYTFWVMILSLFVCLTIILFVDFLLNGIGVSSGGYRPLLTFRTYKWDTWIAILTGYLVLTAFFWIFGNRLKKLIERFNIPVNMLEMIEYKLVAIGFVIFTIGGLIFGAIWADISWGRYWSWDPKETWAFVTWLLYAFYLHLRLIKGYDGIKSSVVAVLGFVVTVFTYVGVNLLMSGLHSYGSM